jgi:Pectate lyase superfamily protein
MALSTPLNPILPTVSNGVATHSQPARYVDSPTMMSVTEWGAAGSGITDDSAIVQAAVNALSGTGLSLFFPSSTYLINTAPVQPAVPVPFISGPMGNLSIIGAASSAVLAMFSSALGGYVSVKWYGAKGDGTTDDSAAIQAAFNALAGTGVTAWFPAGTYVVKEQINLPSFLTIWGGPDVTIKQEITGNVQVSAFSGAATYGTPVSLSAGTTPGSKTISVAALPGPDGAWIFLTDSAGITGSDYIQMSHSGGGPYTLTLDRPVNATIASTGQVIPLTNVPQEIFIFGNGMLFTGTATNVSGQGYVGFGNAYRCVVRDCRADGSGGSIGANGVAFNFDLGSLECEISRCRADGASSCGILFAIQANERTSAVNCDGFNAVSAAYQFYDSWNCALLNCNAYDSAVGISFGSDEGGNTIGSTGCTVIGGNFSGCEYGATFAAGSSYNTIVGSSFNWSSGGSAGIWVSSGVPCVGLVFDDVTILGSRGWGILVQNTGHEISCTNISILESYSEALYCVTGTNKISIKNFTCYDCNFNGGGAAAITFGGTGSKLSVSGGYMATNAAFPAIAWIGFNVTSGVCTIDDYTIASETSGASSTTAVESNGAAATLRIGFGVDTTSCSVPINNVSGTITLLQGQGEFNDATATGTVTLTQVQAQANVLKLTGSLTGNLNYVLPTGVSGLMYTIDASGVTLNGHTLSVGPTGGQVSLTAAQHIVYSDGTNAHAVV